MSSFLRHFSHLENPGIERCKRHQLLDILFLSLAAILCGADGWEEIEDFGAERQDWLKKFLPYENGIPGH